MNRNSRVHRFIKHLRERSLTLALAESITCGLAAHMLSTCKGTSEVFKGAIVCYNGEVKTGLMKIPLTIIKRHTAESRQVTDALAKALKKHIRAHIYAASTGLASAGGSEKKGKPVGTVFFTVIYNKKVFSSRKVFNGTPLERREKACLHLYDLITKYTKTAAK